MKKLNITKKQYDESKYFNKKYGALKFVSESGKLFKTDKGVVLALEGTENQPTEGDGAQGAEGGTQQDESLKDIGKALKDTVKDGAKKIADGAKKGAKAVSNFFNGNFRKNDTVYVYKVLNAARNAFNTREMDTSESLWQWIDRIEKA